MSADHPSQQNSDDSLVENACVEIKGDQAEKDSVAGRLNLSGIDMWALGVCISVSGIFYGWNVGLEAGFGSYMIGRGFVSTAYIALLLCISELSSGLPFAGGAYGIARVTLGPFAGYMVACYESMETVVACSALIHAFAKTVVVIGEYDIMWEPIICAMFYVVYIAIHSWGGRLLWSIIMAFAVGCLMLAVIFLLGSAKHVDVERYAEWPRSPSEHQAWFRGGLLMFVRFVPSCCNGFTCIECVNLACKDVQNPKRDIPRGFVASVFTQTVFCLSVVVVSASLAPGIFPVSRISAPLTFGYMKIFDTTLYKAYAISLPALCAAAFGRMFSYGRQISAMGNSGMLHPIFGQELPQRHTPFNALLLGSALGFGLCMLSTFEYDGSQFQVQLTHLALLGAYTSYIAQLFSFIMFQGTFSIIKREFISPLGIPGAVYAMFWFAACFISLAAFQETHIAITGFAFFTGAALIHYFTVVRFRQQFSDEEKAILFRAHLVKNNTQRAAKIRKGRKPTHVAVGGIRLAVSGVSLNSMSSQPASTAHTASFTHKYPHDHSVEDLAHPHQPVELCEGTGDHESSVPVERPVPLFGLASDANMSTNNSPTNIPPDNTTENPVPSKSRRGTHGSSLIHTIYENITTSLGDAGALLLSSSSSSHIVPSKLATFSIDDIEAETFKASVRLKPSSTRYSSSGKALESVHNTSTSPTAGANAATVTATITDSTIVDA